MVHMRYFKYDGSWLLTSHGQRAHVHSPWIAPISTLFGKIEVFPKFHIGNAVLTIYGIMYIEGIYGGEAGIWYRIGRPGNLRRIDLPENQIYSRWCKI